MEAFDNLPMIKAPEHPDIVRDFLNKVEKME
jgi:hypothetical protein